MAGRAFPAMCECDCGVPDAERQRLAEVPPDDPWPSCACPYCGPEPVQEGGRRQCTTKVHPIVAVFAPGGLLLCEECRASCYRRMHEAKLLRWGRSGTKRTDHTDETEDSGKDKKHRSSTERQGDVSSDMPMDQLGGDLMVSGDYCQNEMLLDPGDQALETFVEGPTVQ